MLDKQFSNKKNVTMRFMLAFVFAVMTAFAANVSAATFVVNDTGDANDATPGNGVCATAGAVCTLRAAITEANALAGADTITLPAGTYTHSLVAADEDANAGGDFDITSPMTINGAGAATTIIQANAAPNTATERVFHVLLGGTAVTIDGVTIQNGNAIIVGAEVGRGGGIRMGNNAAGDSAINLTLTNSTIKNNTAGTRGGGLATNKGNLIVTNCTFDGNQAGSLTQTTPTGGAGGAVIIDSQDNIVVVGQTSTFTNTVMSNNTATTNANNTFGGAVIVRAVDSLVTFNGCNINNNHSTATGATFVGFAGGLYNQQAHMVLNNTVVDSNTSSHQQSGVRNLASTQTAATLDISNSTISNNSAVSVAAGIANVVGGAFDGTVNIDHSTISGNFCTGDGSAGGGIYNSADAVVGNGLINITNSTFSGNSASFGGGIYTDGSAATVLIDFSTFAANTANPDGEGGALLQDATAGGSTFFSNSIFADNVSPIAGTEDLDGLTAQLSSFGYNHVESGVVFTTGTGDVTTGDPALGVLVNNGGTTKTHIPGAASVVLDTIPNATNGCGSPITDDQRGSARPFPAAGACDKGSVERQAAEAGTPTSTSTFTPTPTSTATNTPASTSTNTATATATFTPTPPTCPITVLPTDGSTSGNARAPSTRFAASRAHYLITAAELAAAGYTAGAIPGTIGWNYAAAPVTGGSAPLKIYMENTADATNLKGVTWATAISTMTTVHDATTVLPGTAGPFDITLTGATSFTYTGGGLYIAFDWGAYAGTLSTTSVISTNSVLANSLFGANSASPTVAASAFRPETRLNGMPPLNNDVAVTDVYTYGELPLGAVSGHTVRALVTNNSSVALTNVPVTLNITGANTFSNIQTVPSLAACGGQAIVTFAGFTPASVGSDTVTVTVPADDNNTNNSGSKALNVTALDYSYKHPGSTSSGGVGFNGATGAIVAEFTTNSARSITDVKAEFNSVTATTYKVVIYGDSGSGTPALTPLYEDATDRTVTLAGPVTITLPAPVAVPAGNFYVGLHQTNTTNLSLAYDEETPLRSGSFFEGSPLPPTVFNDLEGSSFKVNIGLILAASATPTSTPTVGGTPSLAGTVTYGNPASPTTKFISNATVTGTGAPNVFTTTAAPGGTAGQYTLTGFGAGNYTVGVAKTTGVNGIASADAARVAQHVAGTLLISTSRQRIAADVTNNGALSSTDAAQIARFVSGLGAPVGLTGQWRFFVPSVTEPTFPIGVSPTTRSYTGPIGVQTGQDYIGILVGETTGNWAPSAARPVAGPERSTAVNMPQLVTPADSEVIIPVSINGAENKGIIAYEFDLRYDPTVIQPQAEPVELAGTVSRGLTAVANPNEPGLLRVVMYGAYPIDSNGLLLNLKFTAVGAPGSVSPLTWERVMFNEGDPGTFATDGTVELSAAAPNQAELTGRVVNTMGQGISNARVTLTNTTTGATRSAMSNGFGAYRFGGLTVGQTYTISVDSKHSAFAPLTVSITGQSVNTDMIAAQ